jgi:glycosyltransferase involved in cell wall biosynthesis
MVARGHHVTVIGLYKQVARESIEYDHGVDVIRLGAARLPTLNFALNTWRLFNRLRQLCSQVTIDIIEGQEAAFAFLPTSLPGKKVIRMHGGYHFYITTLGQKLRFWRAWQEKRSFTRADALCAVSRFVAEATNRILHQEDRKVEVIPNAIDTELFCPQADVHVVNGLIVFVGTLCEKKGVRQLIQALPTVLKYVPDARLLLIGRDSVVPETGDSYIETLRKEISPDIRSKIEFRGVVEHHRLPAIYASAAICVFPSHMEAQGIVVLEAMSVGKAVVSSKLGPGIELIDHGIDGFLCDPGDTGSIAENIVKLLSDKTLRKRIGERARNKVIKLFNQVSISIQNEAYYRKVTSIYPEGAEE